MDNAIIPIFYSFYVKDCGMVEKKEASLSTCLSFTSTLWSEVDELNYANACPSGFCLWQKFISPTSQRENEKSPSFFYQPSGEVDELNYACACPSGFCLRQKFISPTSHRYKKRGKSFNLPLFYLNPLASPRGFEPRFLEWKSNVLDRARR